MSVDRVDRLVAIFFVITTLSVVGMIFDLWQLVYYSIPLVTVLLMLMGALNRRDEWSGPAVVPAAAFGGLLLVLFALGDVLLNTDALMGGLPAATGVFVYVIWPVTTVAGGALFAWVYHKWLRQDLDDTQVESMT